MSEFVYSRLGDCGPCGGTGRIYRYKHIEEGLCFTCKGTGGKRLPEGAYKVYKRLTIYDKMDGATASDGKGAYLGVVQSQGRKWWAQGPEHMKGRYFTSRDAASRALRDKR